MCSIHHLHGIIHLFTPLPLNIQQHSSSIVYHPSIAIHGSIHQHLSSVERQSSGYISSFEHPSASIKIICGVSSICPHSPREHPSASPICLHLPGASIICWTSSICPHHISGNIRHHPSITLRLSKADFKIVSGLVLFQPGSLTTKYLNRFVKL